MITEGGNVIMTPAPGVGGTRHHPWHGPMSSLTFASWPSWDAGTFSQRAEQMACQRRTASWGRRDGVGGEERELWGELAF